MKRYYLYTAVMLLIGFTTACEKFVEVKPPKSKLIKKTVFEEDKTAEAAVMALYSYIRDYGLLTPGTPGRINAGATLYLSLYADEIAYEGSNISSRENNFYLNNLLANDSSVETAFWFHPYKAIFMANAIIAGIDESKTMSQLAKDRMMGDALFVRGMLHFYLTNCFGDIPYVTSVDYNQNKILGKITQDKVYKQVLVDLIGAEKLIGDNYLDPERIRPNKATVKALTSRVYLYQEDWENAIKMATEVIDISTLYRLEEDLDKVFLKESKEAIWQFKPMSSGSTLVNTHEGNAFIMHYVNEIKGINITSALMNSLEAGDKRSNHWFALYERPEVGISRNYSSKYKLLATLQPMGSEYSIVFRLAEQYLIRAEAYAQLDKIGLALNDLDTVRRRAGLQNSTAVSKEDILNAILQERRVELSTEMGHRWFDLKRTGKAELFLKPLKPNWNPNHLLLPIPEKELFANPNLMPQNDGYN